MTARRQSTDLESSGSHHHHDPLDSPVREGKNDEDDRPATRWRRLWHTLNWMPPWCRFDPENPPKFSMWHNVLFGFAGAFTVANLYYNHPILSILARDFDVSYEKVSQIPTLMQAGYAAGLLFLCPLGDLLRRRQFVLTLVFFSATIWCVAADDEANPCTATDTIGAGSACA